jgi:hypothetical protein
MQLAIKNLADEVLGEVEQITIVCCAFDWL